MKILNELPEVGAHTRDMENALAVLSAPEAKNELVLHNLREAWAYAHHICQGKLTDEELYSLCYAGLVKAVKNFKPSRIRFFAYAKPYVRGELSREWKFKDAVKRPTSQMTQPDSYELPAPSVEDLGAEDPGFAKIVTTERWAAVKTVMLAVLSDPERMTIDLSYGGGFSFQAIGDMLGISREAVRETHARSIKKIRDALPRYRALFH